HRWVSFQARSLTPAERSYSATKRELLAVIYALKKFHRFIWGSHFTLFTDHAALTYLHTQRQLNPMLFGWYETLFDYNFSIFHRPGIQNILPDHLSRFFDSTGGEESVQPVQLRLTAVQPDISTPQYAEPDPAERASILQKYHLLGHFGANAL